MGVVYLVRHGQASFGAEDYDQLSELGLEQSRALGVALAARLPEVHRVVTGTQRRHAQTADACLAQLGAQPVQAEHPGFDEFNHEELLERYDSRYNDRSRLAGDLLESADPRRAFQSLFERAVSRWTGGVHDAEYSESWPHFRSRCVTALKELTDSLGPGQTALVFTSGGPITAVCQALLGTPDAEAFRVSWSLVNCGVTKLVHRERGTFLSTLNDHSHFEGAHRGLLTYR